MLTYLKTCSDEDCVFMKESIEKQLEKSTAASGRPLFVQYENIFGAWPLMDNPYKIRDEQKRREFPAENALVRIPALITDGSTFIPARVNAIT